MFAGVSKGTRSSRYGVTDRSPRQFRMRGDTYATRSGEGKPLELVEGEPLDLTFTFLDNNQPATIKAPLSADTADLGAQVDETQAG
ncbi:hypothetical protein ABVB69_12670 [Streptomyces sp. NPDC000349]|uniref:hypothetical protein n=1 Tax=unclassified Streptomyces TaxID=2593676 RepID=UPI00278A50E5|nr:hypothetical protein [Streptomyces sp. DSM 40167]MDQ0405186.1 hypothetical protein [Streptomyces sp. DSM 40167]